VRIGLDATYSLGANLSGVGVYSRELLFGLARLYPEERFRFYYRSHRFFKSFLDPLPPNARRRLLRTSVPRCEVFHSLNQRLDFAHPGSCSSSAPHGTQSSTTSNSSPYQHSLHAVSTFHDLFVMTGDYSTPEFRARFTDQARKAAERSDAIIAVSHFTARQVEQLLHVEPSRIHVIPHGVHLPEQSEQANTSRENLVLFAGVIQRRKNLARTVQAFERMPPGWRLAVAGATAGFGAAAELHAIETSSRRADIDVLGHVSRAALDALYARAGIFAFPSLDEGFGMPVLEAMAHGVPVITSLTSALPEVAGDAALLVNPLDVDEIAQALRRLAEDDALRADLIARGYRHARSFSWETAVKKTWSVYRSLAGTST
jgi:glycosyltransferase involved in cell wall biosynthesis